MGCHGGQLPVAALHNLHNMVAIVHWIIGKNAGWNRLQSSGISGVPWWFSGVFQWNFNAILCNSWQILWNFTAGFGTKNRLRQQLLTCRPVPPCLISPKIGIGMAVAVSFVLDFPANFFATIFPAKMRALNIHHN